MKRDSMNKIIGFDTQKYLDAQVTRILERVSQFDKLYLEFGGKLRFDHHALRVLPGFELDTKIQMLQKIGDKIEIVHCISAKDIERRKVRRDFGLTYEEQILKDISDLREIGLDVSAVVINRFSGEHSAQTVANKQAATSTERACGLERRWTRMRRVQPGRRRFSGIELFEQAG